MLADCPVNDKSYSALHGWRCVSEWLWSKGQQQQCSTQEWALKGCHVKKTCCPGLCLWRAECLVSNFCHVALWLGKKKCTNIGKGLPPVTRYSTFSISITYAGHALYYNKHQYNHWFLKAFFILFTYTAGPPQTHAEVKHKITIRPCIVIHWITWHN